MTTEVVYGFKGFECIELTPEGKQRLKCRDQWYTVGETTHYSAAAQATADIIAICARGFHFCKELYDVNTYYDFGPSIIARVRVPIGGSLIESRDKCVTNSLYVEALLSGKFKSKGNSYLFEHGRVIQHICDDGTEQWWKDGKRHRDGDLPAFICDDGTQWWKYGKLHRDGDLPAIIYANGDQSWWKNGKQHRDGDLPAYIDADGTKMWFKDGNLHRDGDLPALISSMGTQDWYKDGKRHRYGDLPAVIYANGTQEWWKDGKRHRDGDLPAVILADDTQSWWKNGKRHRDGDLPAYIEADGYQEWWKDGQMAMLASGIME